jgi:hypothetical protein
MLKCPVVSLFQWVDQGLGCAMNVLVNILLQKSLTPIDLTIQR